MFEHVLNNQMGNFDMDARKKTIENYHKNHPRKCPKCGSTEIGITYTTGTGWCEKCKSNILLTSKGVVALQRQKISESELGACNFWFEDGTEFHCDASRCSAGPVFCGKIGHICL